MSEIKYDVEDLLFDIQKLLVDNVNDYIAQVDARKIAKGKGLGSGALPLIDLTLDGSGNPKGIFFQYWGEAARNCSPALLYGLADTTSQGNGPATIDIHKIFVEVVITGTRNNDEDEDIRKVFRYAQALKQLFLEKFASLPWPTKLKIDLVSPGSFRTEEETSEEVRFGGVLISVPLG